MVSNYLTDLASQFGVPIWLFIIIFSWIIVWKLLALWKSARNNQIRKAATKSKRIRNLLWHRPCDQRSRALHK